MPKVKKSLKKSVSIVRAKKTRVLRSKTKKISSQPGFSRREFPIVGIGASAGGLEALSELLRNLAPDTGMAFVIIQHLDPKHDSLSAEIFSRVTKMPVHEVKNGEHVEPNHVYMIPPNFRMTIEDGKLHLLPRGEAAAKHMVVDFFLQSLAQEKKQKAIAVILSGTASDGTQGLMAIKEQGGFTFAQEPVSAKYDGMPKSAIASGMVDLILKPAALAAELTRLAKHPYIRRTTKPSASDDAGQSLAEDDNATGPDEELRKIYSLLRKQTRVDFAGYKNSTLKRRITRRIVVQKLDSISAYLKFIESHPEEIETLFNDILINVTEFFRDREVFKELKTHVFPKLIKNRPAGAPIRIWVPGCATGEEAYSIAIVLLECLGDKAPDYPIQIFATDISKYAIQRARIGFYSESLTYHISKDRLSRFFEKTEGGHKVRKHVRDLCIFSTHDVTSDPPFAKLDLVSCRNLLIYFSSSLQKRVIPIFHYALKPLGFLLLGKSEGTAGCANLFTQVNRTNKIFAKNSNTPSVAIHFPLSTYVAETPSSELKNSKSFTQPLSDFQKDVDRILMSEYVPPGVVVNANLEVLQYRGRTGPFVDPAPGQPSFNLLKLVRTELLSSLRMTLQTAKKTNEAAVEKGLDFDDQGKKKTVDIRVIPINPKAPVALRNYLVLFERTSSNEINDEDTGLTSEGAAAGLSKTASSDKARKSFQHRIERLERELHSSKEHLESLANQFDATQEELTSANEELQSTNEEFQSTNEELETAKEELQSTNEELTTVNDELQSRNHELTSSNSDLTNLLGAVEIPIVMVDGEHRIRRYTPKAATSLNLIASDIGRPISDVRSNFDVDLNSWIAEVIETFTLKEVEIKDREGRWSRVQIRPYKTVDNKIDGAVITFMDIDFLKQSLKDVQAARSDAEKANRAKDLFLATLSHELRTPLTAIMSWGQLLQSGKLNSEKAKEAGERIVDSGRTQAQLINDLLDVSKVIMGKIGLDFQELDPTELLKTAVEAILPMAALKSISIETSLTPDIGKIKADPTRLKQVFWNLLTNAVKFSSPNSKILVSSMPLPGSDGINTKVQIKVMDSGKGIKADFLPRIFDHFSQEDNSSIRKHGGLGLGLAIVKNLVELQGGCVEAESLGENRGAIFTVIFPLLRKGIQEKTESLAVAPSSRNNLHRKEIKLENLRVLVVDDEAHTREAVSEILRSLGAKIQTANSVKDALKQFSIFKPDLVVSDIGMPGEDGYSLIKKIRALGKKRGGEVPAVAMTAFAGADEVKRALSAGFQKHLAKPFDADHFAEVVAKVTGRLTTD